MDIYQTEDEQVEALKKWWQENGKSAIFGVLLGLSAIFGWREWQDYETEMAASASNLYQQMVAAAREQKAEELIKVANEISANYESTAYSVFARLALARVAVENDDLDSAITDLRWALDKTSQESLRHVITLRLARVLIAQSKYDEARAIVNSQNQGEFALSYLELEADIFRKEDKISEARQSYEKAISLAKAGNLDSSMLDLKLDDLGREESK